MFNTNHSFEAQPNEHVLTCLFHSLLFDVIDCITGLHAGCSLHSLFEKLHTFDMLKDDLTCNIVTPISGQAGFCSA